MTTIPQDPSVSPDPGYGYAPAPRSTGRAWLAGALVFVGGYLVLTSLTGQLANALGGYMATGPIFTVLLVSQLLFALVVVLVGLIAAPGSGAGKAIGAGVVVVGVPIVLAILTLRLNGALRIGAEASFTIANPWLMTVLLVGAAWLAVRGARLGWLALLGVAVLSPVPYFLARFGAEPGLTPLLMLALSALVGLGILVAGRPWRD
jgi:hypothetical protein